MRMHALTYTYNTRGDPEYSSSAASPFGDTAAKSGAPVPWIDLGYASHTSSSHHVTAVQSIIVIEQQQRREKKGNNQKTKTATVTTPATGIPAKGPNATGSVRLR